MLWNDGEPTPGGLMLMLGCMTKRMKIAFVLLLAAVVLESAGIIYLWHERNDMAIAAEAARRLHEKGLVFRDTVRVP